MTHDPDGGRAPRTLLSRRRALALGASAPLLAAACGRSTPVVDQRPQVPDVPALVQTTWTGRPDGPLPTKGDEGAPIEVVANNGPPPSIADGALVGNLPDAASAAYIVQPLTWKIRRIGAVFGFEPGSNAGSMTLVAWVPFGKPTAHCHVALAPDRWVASTVEDAEVTEFAGGTYRAPLVTDGRPYVVEIFIDGSTTIITLPDGTYASATDDNVGRLTGVGPCWEFFREGAGGAPARLYRSWAG